MKNFKQLIGTAKANLHKLRMDRNLGLVVAVGILALTIGGYFGGAISRSHLPPDPGTGMKAEEAGSDDQTSGHVGKPGENKGTGGKSGEGKSNGDGEHVAKPGEHKLSDADHVNRPMADERTGEAAASVAYSV